MTVELSKIKQQVYKASPSSEVADKVWDSIGAFVEELYEEIETLEEEIYDLENIVDQYEEEYAEFF